MKSIMKKIIGLLENFLTIHGFFTVIFPLGILYWYNKIDKLWFMISTVVSVLLLMLILFVVRKKYEEISDQVFIHSDKVFQNLSSLGLLSAEEHKYRDFIKKGKLEGIIPILNNIQSVVNAVTFSKPRDIKVKCYLFSNNLIKWKYDSSITGVSNQKYYCLGMDDTSFSEDKQERLQLREVDEWDVDKKGCIKKLKSEFLKDRETEESFLLVPLSAEYSGTTLVFGFITVRFGRRMFFKKIAHKYILAFSYDIAYYIDRLRIVYENNYNHCCDEDFLKSVYQHLSMKEEPINANSTR